MSVKYEIRNHIGVVGHYELDPMPGCAKVAISHGLVIDPAYRGKGLGNTAMEERIRLARQQGFQCIICTVVVGNVPQEKIMRRYQFKPVTSFDNPTSGNRVGLWIKNITDPYDCGFYEPGGCR